MNTTEKRCEVCNKKFGARTADLDRGYGRTCSRACGAKMREMAKRGDIVEPVEDFRENELDYNPYEDE